MCATRTRTQVLRRWRHWLHDSNINGSNAPTAFLRKCRRKFIRCCLYYYRQCRIFKRIEYLNNRIIKSLGALCRFDDALVRNLILGPNNRQAPTALWNNLEHLHNMVVRCRELVEVENEFISDCLASVCQKLPELVLILQKIACFFETLCKVGKHT